MLFLICNGIYKCILLKFVALSAVNNILNSNFLKSYQLGDAYTLCGWAL